MVVRGDAIHSTEGRWTCGISHTFGLSLLWYPGFTDAGVHLGVGPPHVPLYLCSSDEFAKMK